ncbi:hypothetical protein ACQ9KE_26670, partial [Klebsiella pneumoniae]
TASTLPSSNHVIWTLTIRFRAGIRDIQKPIVREKAARCATVPQLFTARNNFNEKTPRLPVA